MTVSNFDVARIESGVVTTVWRDTTKDELSPDDPQLYEFSPGVVVAGMLWDGQSLENPATSAEQYAERLDRAKRDVVAYAESLTVQLKGIVLSDEQASWPDKKDAAYLYQANIDGGGDHTSAYTAAASSPSGKIGQIVIDNEIAITGEDWGTVVAKIIARAEFYALAIGKVTAVRRNIFSAIDALGATPTDEAIDGVINVGKAQADTEFSAVLAQVPA